MRCVSLTALFLLAGCATAPTGGLTHKGGAFCNVTKPVRIAPEAIDKMTDGEVEAALAHNEDGARECGWKPGASP